MEGAGGRTTAGISGRVGLLVLPILSLLVLACGNSRAPLGLALPSPSATTAVPAPVIPTPSQSAASSVPIPTPETARDSPTPAGSDTGVNLIAYANHDGQVFVVRPDGSNASRISPDEGVFTWPVWSPDGKRVSFSGASIDGDGRGPLALYLYDLDDRRSRTVYTNDPRLGPILPGMPHYPLWSPDGARLAFMAGAPQGLTLFVTDTNPGSRPELVVQAAPLYASWSADSTRLVVHGGVDILLADVNGRVSVEAFGVQTDRLRVPAWWPAGDRIALVASAPEGDPAIYVTDVESDRRTHLETVPGSTAFLWSPDGEMLAASHTEPGSLVSDGISVFSAKGRRLPVSVEDEDEDIVAFFWSPDSAKLAYVSLADGPSTLRWMVLDVRHGNQWPLADFEPSAAQATLLTFFDQFAYSHSPWSPSSDALVFAGTLANAGVSASMSQQPASHIFVVGSGRNPLVQRVADGFLAVWSPR